MTNSLSAGKRTVWQFTKFCAVGLANTLIGYGTILLASFVLGLNAYAANVCGYAVGLLVSFLLNRRFTFESRQAALPALAKFLLAFLPSYGLNLVVLYIILQHLQFPEALAQALAIGTYTVTFFVLCCVFVFRAPESNDRVEGVEKGEPMLQDSSVNQLGQGDAR